jgi:general secretion pathway protein B
MSYILDALKKADAERERRGVPSLSAQSATLADDERRRGGLGIALGVAALVALALGAWWWWSGRNGTSAPVPTVAAAPVAAAPVAAPTAPPPAPTTTVPAPTPAPVRPLVVPPPPVIVPPAPVVAAPMRTPPATVAAPTVTGAPTATAAPGAPADSKTPALAELSPDLRRQLPPLNVSGAVYTPQAAGRMLFINGQVLREGDAVAEGLVVERIGAKSSVLSLRGTRFELKH